MLVVAVDENKSQAANLTANVSNPRGEVDAISVVSTTFPVLDSNCPSHERNLYSHMEMYTVIHDITCTKLFKSPAFR